MGFSSLLIASVFSGRQRLSSPFYGEVRQMETENGRQDDPPPVDHRKG
jgi:hypothetical protein